MIIDEIFQQAIDDHALCGWTTHTFLNNRPMRGPNIYVWNVPKSGLLEILVEKVMDHPTAPDVVMYLEVARR